MKQGTKRLLWALALLLLAAVLVFVNLPEPPSRAEGAQVGQQLPDFSIRCVDGGEFSLSAQRGKVVVLNLWATWCTPCVKELPHFDRLQKEQGQEVAVLALHSPPVTADVKEWLAGHSYEIPFAVDEDGSISALLGASTVLPQTVILSPDGAVCYNQSGALSYEKLLELVATAKS
ncbi:MAG: TlpA family protein disulfide reductase [Oscillospiraceae bacterium]|nr:TlpA family protein disulfide reductase [Oscillospiraceae bacterium]